MGRNIRGTRSRRLAETHDKMIDPPTRLSFDIPLLNGSKCPIHAKEGDVLFIVGPNGSGKSALMHYLHENALGQCAFGRVKWLAAHRRSWLSSSAVEITAASKLDTEKRLQSQLRRSNARYHAHYDDFINQAAILALVQKMNEDARSVYQAVKDHDHHHAQRIIDKGDVLGVLNGILRRSNMHLTISVGASEDVLATKSGSVYGVNQMSDGERNVLLLASEVLTAEGGSLLLIDEPEKHLHRSIISPLLSALFQHRSDCIFIISTHEVSLPMDNPQATTVTLRDCHLQGSATTWDMDLISSAGDLPEDVLRAILGARRQVVFIEGEASSLDYPLYASVFPRVSFIPVGSCVAVKNAVRSIRSCQGIHGIEAFGVVDGDRLDEGERDSLEREKIFVVDGYSVEAIYYESSIQRMIANRVQPSGGVEERIGNAQARAMDELRKRKEYLCEFFAKDRLRQAVLRELSEINVDSDMSIDVPSRRVIDEERSAFEAALERHDLDELIRRYPVKKTPALKRIATEIGFRDRRAYERAVIGLIQSNKEARQSVLRRFGGLGDALSEGKMAAGRTAV